LSKHCTFYLTLFIFCDSLYWHHKSRKTQYTDEGHSAFLYVVFLTKNTTLSVI
jgi:hypothetical protein